MVYIDGMWSIDVELIEPWLDSLDDGSWKQVMAAIGILEDRGPQLGRLVAGDKSRNWARWYTKNIPVADDLFDAHLRALEGK